MLGVDLEEGVERKEEKEAPAVLSRNPFFPSLSLASCLFTSPLLPFIFCNLITDNIEVINNAQKERNNAF
jgi:hypothetical protein